MTNEVTTSAEATSNENTSTATETAAISNDTKSEVVSKDTGETPKSWVDELPKELQAETLKKFKDRDGVIKGYIEAEKSLGKSIKIPTDKSTPEEIDAFYTKIGRPESKGAYGLNDMIASNDALLSVMPAYKEQVKEFGGLAFDLGLPKAAAQKILEWNTNQLNAQLESMKTKTAEADAMLKKTWAADYESNKASAEAAFKALEGKYPEQAKDFRTSDFARNPLSMIMLSELNKLYKESTTQIPGGSSPASGGSIQDEIASLNKADRSHPLWNDRDPGHKQAVDHYNSLYAKLFNASR